MAVWFWLFCFSGAATSWADGTEPEMPLLLPSDVRPSTPTDSTTLPPSMTQLWDELESLFEALVTASDQSVLDWEIWYAKLQAIQTEVDSLRDSAERAWLLYVNSEQLRSEEKKLYASSRQEWLKALTLERSRNQILWDIIGATALAGGIACYTVSAFPDTRLPGLIAGSAFSVAGCIALFGPWRSSSPEPP